MAIKIENESGQDIPKDQVATYKVQDHMGRMNQYIGTWLVVSKQIKADYKRTYHTNFGTCYIIEIKV